MFCESLAYNDLYFQVKCHFDMAQSFFGFSDDCPTTSTCSKIEKECPEFTIKNDDVDVEIFV